MTSYTDTTRRRKHHLQLHGARGGRGREPVRSQQHGQRPRRPPRRVSRSPPRPTPGSSSPRPRRTTPRPTCAPTAAPTPPPTASCASRWVESWAACRTPSCASTPTPPRRTARRCTRPATPGRRTRSPGTPARSAPAPRRDDKGAIAANTWVEYNVTPFVTGNGTYSFTLAQTSSDGVDFRAREYTANRPELVLTTGVDSQKPTPPGNLTATAGTGPGGADLAGLDRQRRGDGLPGVPRDHADRRLWARRRPPTPTPAWPRAPTATRCGRSTPRRTSRIRATRQAPRCRDTTKPTRARQPQRDRRHRARSR